MYGWRAKVGLLVPSINTIVEHDFHRMAPLGVSVHSSRVPTEVEGTLEALADMGRAAKESAALLAPAKPDVVVFGCTSASFINGPDWTANLEQEIAQVAGCPCVSTGGAMVSALRHMNGRRVAVVTPYVDRTNERLKLYLTTAGFEVTELRALRILDMYAHADVTSQQLYAEARALNLDGVDAIFIACTQMKTIDMLDVLEQDLRRPVISAVQASFWGALHALGDVGLPIAAYGSLLRGARSV